MLAHGRALKGLLAALLWLACVFIAGAATPDGAVGPAPEDLVWALVNSLPVSVLLIAITAWFAVQVIDRVLRWRGRRKDPNDTLRHTLQDVERRARTLAKDLHYYERRAGKLLVQVRHLEAALTKCRRDCPECDRHFQEEMARADRELERLGLKRKEDPTIPGAMHHQRHE